MWDLQILANCHPLRELNSRSENLDSNRRLGRVVKAVDSKSTGLRPHRFESGRRRSLFLHRHFWVNFRDSGPAEHDLHQRIGAVEAR